MALLPRGTSLRVKLMLWVLGIFVLIQSMIGAAFWLYQRHTIRELFEQRLLERARSMEIAVEAQLPGLTTLELARIASQELG